ncbi:hypothetical protein LLS1_38640 [Leifsonia sp. LS1]|uniref:sugar phosphate isomerase/epimerase family protein n=1 Tax=Leifsonia sp. LS1 TaxID=2828483 RepID=UPI001CFD3EBD|nr:sugar phosphate isomerase/epimerase family protein [Leifsonia sp. LS1]GIT82195.1 hypothetical protein LLS1_38640 [Leifsonia sp. LS1]
MKLSFSTLACPTWSSAQAIQAAVDYGYDGIEWRLVDGEILNSSMPLGAAAKLGDATRAAGLTTCAADTGVRDVKLILPPGSEREGMLTEARAMLKVAAALGAEYLRVFPGDCPDGVPREVANGWATANIQALSDDVQASGVRLALELHDAPGSAADSERPTSSQVAMQILEGIGEEAGGILWDWGNTFLEGEQSQVTWEKVRSRLLYCHTKDMLTYADGSSTYVAAGSGAIPIQDILGWLAEQGMQDMWLSYEWEKKWHPELAEPEVALPQYVEFMRSLDD